MNVIVDNRKVSKLAVTVPQLLLVTKVNGQRGWGYLVTKLPVDNGHIVNVIVLIIEKCQLPQLLLVTKVNDQRDWGYQVTRLPVDNSHNIVY